MSKKLSEELELKLHNQLWASAHSASSVPIDRQFFTDAIRDIADAELRAAILRDAEANAQLAILIAALKQKP